jgi:reactive intermediate/imine deaminase
MSRQSVEPKGVAPPGGHYSHAVVAPQGTMIHVAGQVSLDEEGTLVGAGDAAAQARQVLVNLGRVLEAAGATLDDVVKTTVYLTDLDSRGPVNGARLEAFTAPPPANTLLVVSSLALPEFLVEIEAVAVIPSG